MLKSVLWDNDGVLVDTEKLYYQANRDILATVGAELSPETFAEISLHHGQSVLDVARPLGVDPDSLRSARDEHYTELLLRHAEPAKGAEELLTALDGNVRMAIVTSALPHHFQTIHGRMDLLRHVEFAIARGDYPRSKPAPDPYLTALERGGFCPDHTVVVEDSLRGLGSAIAAGLRCIVVRTPFTEGMDFPGAWRVADNLRAVKEILLAELSDGRATAPQSCRCR